MSGFSTFLDVAPFKEGAIDNKTLVNAAPTCKMPSKVRDYLRETYAPMINRIAGKLGSYATMWDGIESPYSMKSPSAYPTTPLPPVLHP
jgi:hypothetical protein